MLRHLVIVLTAALLTVSCTRDRNTLKKKYLDAGDRYFAKQKYREASIMYRSAIKHDPLFGEGYYSNAWAMLRLNDIPKAERNLRRALELLPEGPHRVVARVQLSDIYLAYMIKVRRDVQLIKEVDRLCIELLALDQKSFDGHRLRGALSNLKALNLAGTHPGEAVEELQNAIADLRAADAVHPYRPEVVASLTRALWANKQPQEAEKYLKGLLRVDPRFADGYYELHHFYLKNSRLKDAEENLQSAVEHLPDHFEFLAELARLYQKAGRRADMAKTLDRLKAKAADSPKAFELSGQLFLDAAQPDQAVAEFEEGVRRFPKNHVRFQKLIVDALMAQNKKADANKLNDQILRENPADADAMARKGEYALQNGEVDKAIATLEQLLQRTPNHPAAHFNMGRALLMAGRAESARFHLAEAIRWAPDSVPPRIALTRLEIASGQFGDAATSAEAILEADPKNGEARVLRTMALRGLGKLGDARAEVKTLLEMYPHNDLALFQLGEVNAADNRWQDAEAAYRKSYQANPANIGGLLAIADYKMNHGKADEAIDAVGSELKKHPDRLDLRLARGAMATRAGRKEEAAADYKILLGKFEKNPKALADINLRMGELYLRSGAVQEAVGYLEKARQLRPNDAATLHSLGVVYDVLGRKKEAAALYEASLRINGQNPVVMNNLAYYISQHGGNLDQALTYAQRARQSSPAQLEFSDTVAYIYLKKNLVENALEILEVLVSKKPNEAVFRLHLGEALLKKGETEKGRKELQVALTHKPTAEDAARIKELLGKNGA